MQSMNREQEVSGMQQMATNKYTILDLRAELDLSQFALAEESRLDQATISHLERGRPIKPVNERKVWQAINRLRKQKGLPPLEFEAINWNR
jgi:DNA-binding XRE family transcriptional regulator